MKVSLVLAVIVSSVLVHNRCGAYGNRENRNEVVVSREKRSEKELENCGNKTYHVDSHFCCEDQLYSTKKYQLPSCCGSQPYNFTSHRCCQSTLHVRVPKYRCCSNKTYHPASHLCCLGRLYSKKPYTWPYCCADKPYDYKTHFCCGKTKLFPKGTTQVCCGSNTAQQYNKDTHFCCGGKVYLRSLFPYPGCCSQKPLSYINQMCCSGVIYDKGPIKGVNNPVLCCGKRTYDTRTHSCCGKTVVKKYNDTEYSCCIGDGFGKLIPKSGNSTLRCCEYRGVYDIKDDICCGGGIWWKRIADACCGNRLGYNTKTHICCKGRVFLKEHKIAC